VTISSQLDFGHSGAKTPYYSQRAVFEHLWALFQCFCVAFIPTWLGIQQKFFIVVVIVEVDIFE